MIIWEKYMKADVNKSLHICYQNADWFPDIYIKNWHSGFSIILKGDNRKGGLTDTTCDASFSGRDG